MNRIPLAVFLVDDKGKFTNKYLNHKMVNHGKSYCKVTILVFAESNYFAVSGLRLFNPQEDTGDAGSAIALAG